MKIKSYCAGHYVSANNTVTVWIVDEYCFFELNSKGWKHLIAESFEDLVKEKFIFEEYYHPEENYPDEVEENQIELENERIIRKIKKFLLSYTKIKKHKIHNPGFLYYKSDVEEKITEWCSECCGEVEIINRHNKQKCPECDADIWPCVLCDLNRVNCAECIIE